MKELIMSKKFQAAIFSTIILIAAKFGFQLDATTLGILASPLVAYIGAQGLADFGKPAAVIQAAAAIESNEQALTLERERLQASTNKDTLGSWIGKTE